MRVSGQRHAPAVLPPPPRQIIPVPIVQEAGWAPGPIWSGVDKGEFVYLTEFPTLKHPSRSEPLYRLRYQGPLICNAGFINFQWCNVIYSGFFHWHNPFGRTMALGSTQSLIEMSTRNISWGVNAAGAYGWQPTTFICRFSRNLGASTSWNPNGLSRPVMGLLYLF
jgi:hypothetical protein